MATVLVVEDEPAVAALIELNLEHAGYTVKCAQDVAEAKSLIDEQLPDLLVLDWMLPSGSGVNLARLLRATPRTRDVPIIMLTARAQEDDRVAGLEAGADDYIVKPFSTKEFLARVKAVLRRKAPHIASETIVMGVLALNPATHEVTADGMSIKLGPTEFKLLHFLMAHPQRVHSRSQLLDRVWGDHVFIEERTVDVHIKRLREALEVGHCAELIETVRGAGYRLSAPC
jgi:two-component system phosphate regulon response regulator PhoB